MKRRFVVYFDQVNADKVYVEADNRIEAVAMAKAVWRVEHIPFVRSIEEEGVRR